MNKASALGLKVDLAVNVRCENLTCHYSDNFITSSVNEKQGRNMASQGYSCKRRSIILEINSLAVHFTLPRALTDL
jgi:hypothetical protein